MAQSSEFCLAQQALHEARSLSETLPNTRRIAENAAKAWAREAALAVGAERRRAGRVVSDDDAAITAEFAAEDAADARLSS